MVLFASCGEGHHAKRLVENFMKDDMGVADYSVVSWTKLDSTFRVNDSVLTSMHQQALSEKPGPATASLCATYNKAAAHLAEICRR